MNEENSLWSGESVFCVCGHHVENHRTTVGTIFWPEGMCSICVFVDKNGVDVECDCREFRPYKYKTL